MISFFFVTLALAMNLLGCIAKVTDIGLFVIHLPDSYHKLHSGTLDDYHVDKLFLRRVLSIFYK